MKLDTSFLRSKVGYRIFFLFILCALLPITALAVLSFSQVTKQLNEQSRSRLQQAAKATTLTLQERLVFLENELKLVAPTLVMGSGGAPALSARYSENLTKRFKALALVMEDDIQISLLGNIENPPTLSESEKHHMNSGNTLLTTQSHPNLQTKVFMSRMLNPKNPDHGILVGEVSTTYLWDIEEQSTLPAMTEVCVLDPTNKVMYSSTEIPASFTEQVASALRQSGVGQFDWRHKGEEYLASYRSIFLQQSFFTPKWIVVVSESKSDVLSPMAYFKKIFPLVILMSILVVLLLSVIQIRRSLVPLEKLQEGTKRIAARDFDSRVTIKSGDEFEELATSFNMMASRLGKQFNALTTMGEIDRAILSTLDTRKIVDTLLTRMQDVLPCDYVSVGLIDPDTPDVAYMYISNGNPENEIQEERVQLQSEEIQKVRDTPESFFITDGDVPNYLAPLAKKGIKSFLVLPIFLKEKLSAIIALGNFTPPVYSQDDLVQARQLANQMAVALSNARLIQELDQLNWGTLTALARSIDAKSAWTAGHSERVTKLALKIGKVLGFTQKELDNLHRGGLLHDTGKIGTPASILDKPGALTDEEYKLMREHVRIGARILEPIAAYAEVIPIVLQHHEKYDGTGYPQHLSGEEINLGARIFAVADCYDAMVSDRPYRPGMDRQKVIEIIKEEAGRHFDPKVVRAFLEVMAQEEGGA